MLVSYAKKDTDPKKSQRNQFTLSNPRKSTCHNQLTLYF